MWVEVGVGWGRKVVLAKAMKIANFRICAFLETSLHWSKAWKMGIWATRRGQCLQGCFLPGGSEQLLEVSGEFPAPSAPVITLDKLCRKYKIIIILQQLFEGPGKWPNAGRRYKELSSPKGPGEIFSGSLKEMSQMAAVAHGSKDRIWGSSSSDIPLKYWTGHILGVKTVSGQMDLP